MPSRPPPWRLLSPLTYLYASYRRRLSRIEPVLRRFAGYFSAAIILLALYLGLLALTGAPNTSRARMLFTDALLSGVAVLVIARGYLRAGRAAPPVVPRQVHLGSRT